MRFRKTLTLLILATGLVFALSAWAQQKPFTHQQVSNMVRDRFGDESGAKLIEQRGIEFAPAAGWHELRVTAPGKTEYWRTISVAAGQEARVEAPPTDLAGTVVVESSPGAEVYLDGSSRGTADATGHLSIDNVAAGSHELRIAAAGKKVYQQNITVTAGQEAKVEAPLAALGPTTGEVRVNPEDGLKYVWISPGTFMMGCSPGDIECSPGERPAHQVTITRGFWMGQVEVTVGAYKHFAAATGRPMPPEPSFSGRHLNPGWVDAAMPIVNVTWDEAQAYCSWAGGRLPTEAEWEYAARAGTTAARYDDLREIAWYADNSGIEWLDSAIIAIRDPSHYFKHLYKNGNGFHEVGLKRASGFGIYDILGNVWQWVNDWYDTNYYQNSPSQDPRGPTTGRLRVVRGGSWGNIPRLVRVSFRGRDNPATRGNFGGFRCGADGSAP